MSTYYNISGLKVRVSDHEPNERLNGSNDIELYTVDACGQLLSVEAQIEYICERRQLDIALFAAVLSDFEDGSYTINHFKAEHSDSGEETPCSDFVNLHQIQAKQDRQKLSGLDKNLLGGTSKKSALPIIREIAEKYGVSQNMVKNYFGIKY